MARQPRYKQVRPHDVSCYHVMSRCVRKMRLTEDVKRKDFMLGWLKQLHAVFAVEVCRYALMGNHFHLILRVNLDMAKDWSDREVVERWFRLHPPRDGGYRPLADAALENWIVQQVQDVAFVASIRQKLVDMGQFMKDFKQRVAEVFNREDGAAGAFWEGRYVSIPLEGESQLLACMAYVDLNPHAAGLCERPEDDPHVSLHESVVSREKERKIRERQQAEQGNGREMLAVENAPAHHLTPAQAAQAMASGHDGLKNPQMIAVVPDAERHAWTVPVCGTGHPLRKSLFPSLRLEDYLRLVDCVARRWREGKAQLEQMTADILDRIHIRADHWLADMARWLEGGVRAA